jgi:hypothetical protein
MRISMLVTCRDIAVMRSSSLISQNANAKTWPPTRIHTDSGTLARYFQPPLRFGRFRRAHVFLPSLDFTGTIGLLATSTGTAAVIYARSSQQHDAMATIAPASVCISPSVAALPLPASAPPMPAGAPQHLPWI